MQFRWGSVNNKKKPFHILYDFTYTAVPGVTFFPFIDQINWTSGNENVQDSRNERDRMQFVRFQPSLHDRMIHLFSFEGDYRAGA